MSIRAILIGNPNSGKTTLFNTLTGKKLKTGNRAGVTVFSTESLIKNDDILLVDTPGLYSLSPYTPEEISAVNELKKGGIIVNVVDATSIERGLYLTHSLIETDVKPIVFLTMKKRAEKLGIFIDEDELSKKLKTKVISDKKKLIRLIKRATPFFFEENKLPETEKIYELVEKTVVRTVKRKNKKTVTEMVDRIILHPVLAFPIFALIMTLMFFLVYKSGDLIEKVLSVCEFSLHLNRFLRQLNFSPIGDSLLRNGIISGVGSVFSFLPRLFVFFSLSAILESTGYMARVAVSFDRLFLRCNLSGKAIIPFILGSGCSVPAILSAKTIKPQRERQKISTLVPFIPCSAKLPIIALFAGYFFKTSSLNVTIFIYFLSVTILILLCLITRNKNYEPTLLPELPLYAFPNFKQVFSDAAKRSLAFIKKTGTVIFSVSIVVWFLSSFSFTLQFVGEKEKSILAFLGKMLSPVIYPVIGTLSWAATISVILGFVAKEEVVSSMSILAGTTANIFSSSTFSFFTFPTACAYLIFVIFSSPCVAAISTMKKEIGLKKTAIAIIFQNLLALTLSSIIRLLLMIFRL